jgi:predicted membrane protein (TIGR00267 family)
MPKNLKDFILGWQDGVVNVLGIILAISAATSDARIVIIAGLAATFAESISMAAVGYTSSKAAKDYYTKEMLQEKKDLKSKKHAENHLRNIYMRKGFSGRLLNQVMKKIMSNKKILLETVIKEDLDISLESIGNPLKNAVIIGLAAIIGSLIPVAPFFFMNVQQGMIWSLIISLIVLFIVGAVKAKVTVGNWVRSGTEMAIIGIGAALIGYGIGVLIGAV